MIRTRLFPFSLIPLITPQAHQTVINLSSTRECRVTRLWRSLWLPRYIARWLSRLLTKASLSRSGQRSIVRTAPKSRKVPESRMSDTRMKPRTARHVDTAVDMHRRAALPRCQCPETERSPRFIRRVDSNSSNIPDAEKPFLGWTTPARARK